MSVPSSPVKSGDAAARWFALGLAHLDSGELEQAEECYRKVLALDPGHAKAHTNLGLVLQQRGADAEAARCYAAAIASDPGLAQPSFNLGTIFLTRDEPVAALQHLARAIQLDPARAEWHAALGAAYQRAGRPLEALASLRTAIRLDPAYASAHNELGVCLLQDGDAAQAAAAFRRVLELDAAVAGASSNLLFALNFLPEMEPEAVYRAHVHWARAQEAAAQRFEHDNPPDPERRLKVGYLSPDFCGHALPFFIEPILHRHDRSRFEVICYSDVRTEDAITWRLRAYDALWHACERWTDEALAKQIRADGIDILVDLAGHTAGGRRMALFARKPAPVQVSWLGYLNTTGLHAMDYRLTDGHACPEGMERYHSERLVRLPNSQWCYRPPATAPAVVASARDGAVTFGSFHNLAKLTPPVYAAWAKILQALPGSRLVIVAHGADQLSEAIAARFSAAGVGAQRIECHGGMPLEAYLSLHNRIDIGLDAFPYAGGTTTLHSLWMGVPVVTRDGANVVSKGGVAILTLLGLTELIAQSDEQYVEIALALAKDRERLARMRAGLRQRLAQSALTDEKRFASDLEGCYRQMWRRWCEGARAPADA